MYKSLSIEDKIAVLSGVVSSGILSVVLHPVKLILEFRPLELDYDMIDDIIGDTIYGDKDKITEDDKQFIKKLIQEIREWNYDTVVLNCKQLNIVSKQNGNDDTRGGGCGDFNFPVKDFRLTFKKENGEITLKTILEGVYRLKGSKYDFWYELFEDLKLVSSGISKSDGTENNTFDKIKLLVSFGYGS